MFISIHLPLFYCYNENKDKKKENERKRAARKCSVATESTYDVSLLYIVMKI